MTDATISSPLNDSDLKITGEALQGALVDMIDLSLLAKQAHWTVVGKRFRSLHLQLDETVTLARTWMDEFAERASAIGYVPDGRARTVAELSPLPTVEPRWTDDETVVQSFVAIYAAVISRMRDRIRDTEPTDPVTQDMFIGATAQLEKAAWMFQAEQ